MQTRQQQDDIDSAEIVEGMNFGGKGKDGEADRDQASLRFQRAQRYRQDTSHRRFLAYWVIGAVSVWLLLVIVLVYLCAFGLCGLSDVVMDVLLATTTVNVLGLAYIVLKGLFK